MIKHLIDAAKSTISQQVSQPAAEPAASEAPSPAPPAEKRPDVVFEPTPDLTPRAAAEAAAKVVGYEQGDEVNAEIVRGQKGIHPHLLMILVPDWEEECRCWVKDARSWLPVNPPFNRVRAKYTGTASVEGQLVFESSDICKANRLRRTQR